MHITVPCMTWLAILWGRMFSLFTQIEAVDLPNEIIMDIFSRLPARLIFQCRHASATLQTLTSSQSFVNMHLARATLVIAIHRRPFCMSYSSQNGIYKDKVLMYFIDDKNKEMVPKSMHIIFSCTGYSMLVLYGSYNGLLLFENCVIYIFWNPVTEEQTIVKKPSTVATHGFFFDPKTREYKVLYVKPRRLRFQFTLYSLATRCSGTIAKCSHPPWVKTPVILNGALHWVVDRFYYKCLYRRSLLFSESILSFDMNTETIRTMARPGNQYGTGVDNTYVHLLKKEGSLCFCDTSLYPSMNFWRFG